MSPSLRPQLGVGFNRALPSAFGFDNCAKFDGTNDYIIIPGFNGSNFFDTDFSIEAWTNQFTGTVCLNVNITGNANKQLLSFRGTGYATSSGYNRDGVVCGLTFTSTSQTFTTSPHYVLTFNRSLNLWRIYLNGGNTVLGGYTFSSSTAIAAGQPVVAFEIGRGFSASSMSYSSSFTDEFRVYNKALTPAEVAANYNNGIGNNPVNTENLQCWFKFQSLETLDFSSLQDNSDLRTNSIRDISGKNRHGQPINITTGTFLQPFP